MTKETLVSMGLSEEQAKSVMESLDGDFVPKTRFNEVNTELAAAKETIKARDKQLEDLRKSAGDADAMKKQIEALQSENAEQKKAHEEEMKKVRIDNAVELALASSKAKNNVAVKALMQDFLSKAELAEDGSVKGLEAEIKRLTSGKDTAFLFETQPSSTKFKGTKPSEGRDEPPEGMNLQQFHALSPQERYAFYSEHPDEYKALYNQGGK